ncbi:MAG: PD40 domain-containing protein [Verrucomicrobia bacterium]|nr:PD40 domain-containing protein [Verrucomicrobiota bacterium]
MRRLTLFLLGWISFSAAAQTPLGYYRFPTLHGTNVVFTSEGDLWRVSTQGGAAQRLTSHPGTEQDAVFSPDGTTLAFVAEYEGPNEVYTMPAAGGLPTRHTFDGSEPSIASWTPDQQILFRTTKHSTLPNSQLVRLNPQTGVRELLPLAQAAEGVMADDNQTLFFTRLPKQSSSTKRYQGGWIENLWRFPLNGPEAVPLTTDFQGTSRNPMWWQGRIYFISDRDGTMNLWSMNPEGADLRQLTRHTAFDLQTANLQGGRIVYARAGDIHLYDLATGTDTRLNITLVSDFDQTRERWVKRPLDFLTSAHISPTGDRLALTARGQVFVAPLELGRLVEVPRRSGVRYRDAQFLPGGTNLLTQSDESQELEFWTLPANGVGAAQQITTNGTVFRFPAQPSPDGLRVAWGDKDRKFWMLELATGVTTLIAENGNDEINDFAWSPDSRWLAYVAAATNDFPRIHLCEVATGKSTAVTSDRLDSYSPAWSPDGKRLYFLSDRQLRSLVGSPWGPRQPDPFFTETTLIFALALQRDLEWPFRSPNELTSEKPKKEEKPKDEKTKDEPAKEPAPEGAAKDTGKTDEKPKPESEKPKVDPVVIELAGIETRLFEVPVPAGNYRQLSVTRKHLFWIATDTGFDAKSQLRQIEISRDNPKPKTVVEDLTGYEFSGDGKKILIRKGDNFYVIASDAGANAKLEDKFNLDGWTFALVPQEEWRQIFVESWRMMRDYFYDRNLHRLDWPALRDKYLPLVNRVSDRAELSEVIAEMVAELSTLHVFVRYGDERDGPDQVKPASLGGRLTPDPAAGGWRVNSIFQSDPNYPETLSPLHRPSVNLQVGDVITRFNGRATTNLPHLDSLLRNQAGRQVLLEVKDGGTNAPREVIVKPITADQEADLRYDDWEYTRRKRVETEGKGQIGYVHLRAMGTENIAEWARDFYPVFNRQGLIIDVRNNRGGNIDSWILGKLLRKAWFYWQPRVGNPTWNMQYAFRGHLVVLCNERTASDGEAFAEGFKRLGLGKVIGTRTWGGEIWLSARRWLVDSGMASAAELGVYGPEGQWLIEGHGVDPDLVVDNLPHATFLGQDSQLEAALKHLQELIARDPRPVPPRPSYPDKRFPK